MKPAKTMRQIESVVKLRGAAVQVAILYRFIYECVSDSKILFTLPFDALL